MTDAGEQDRFFQAGLGQKHFMEAMRHNLDLENYQIFKANKKNKIIGSILVPVGFGLAGFGVIYSGLGAMALSGYGTVTGGTREEVGGTFVGTGIVLLAGGVVSAILGFGKLKKAKTPVIMKDGRQMAIIPVLSNDNLGLSLSMRL
jgi:hypothetical protein